MKICIKCKKKLDESNFYKHPRKEGVTINECKKCKISYISDRNKGCEKRKAYIKQYYAKNKETLLEKARVYDNKKRSENDIYRIKYNVSHNLRESLKRVGSNKNTSVVNIIGCSISDLVNHLNDNKYGFVYGDKNLDIDHIIPTISSKNKEELLKLYHYSNLQLLPSYYNRHIKRDNSFDKKHFEEWLKSQKN